MSKANPISLEELKVQMASDEVKRQEAIERGARAYRLGIEKHNCPTGELSQRNLWIIGYDRAKKEHEAMFSRRGDHHANPMTTNR
jgi:ribosome modulation factor